MARIARIVIPDVAHHVTQRGNRNLPIFFSDADRETYLKLIIHACERHGTRCLAWCLMDNHVHLILIPKDSDGLRATLGEAHRRYTVGINVANGWSGYLFQGRFASYAMDDAHLSVAVRYVENNPVTAGMVAQAQDWCWSSARAHVSGKSDGLTDIAAFGDHIQNWRAMLAHGLEASDETPTHSIIEAAMRSGRPVGGAAWIKTLESETGRDITPKRRGPKPKAPNSGTQY